MNIKHRSSAKGKWGLKAGEDKDELKQLENDLKRSQANNLIAGQEAQMMSLNGPTSTQGDGVQVIRGLQQRKLDQGAAELQWEKVSQAQDIAATKIMPLRINLPKRGLRFSFTQVLQTEVGKPMVVEFRAVNQQASSWTGRIAWGIMGLLIMWAVVALTFRRLSC
jgi:hypothetical protein